MRKCFAVLLPRLRSGYTCCAHSSMVVSLWYACDFWRFLACRGELTSTRATNLSDESNHTIPLHFSINATSCDFTRASWLVRERASPRNFGVRYANISKIFIGLIKNYKGNLLLSLSLKQDQSYVSLSALLTQVNHYERIEFWL